MQTKSIISALLMIIAVASVAWGARTNNPENSLQLNQILSQTHELKSNVLEMGITAYTRAKKDGLTKKPIVTIVDYSLPSSKKRFWVIDLDHNHLLYQALVAQGKGSGPVNNRHFSDRPGSDASSIGVFLTGSTYTGHNGYSLRLYGLDHGYNDKAYNRTIVIHQAWYVSEAFIKKYGRLGRSWGCFALEKGLGIEIMNTIKDGSIILAYYPDRKWIESSKFTKPKKYTLIMNPTKIWQPR